jgi:hypothetical protein
VSVVVESFRYLLRPLGLLAVPILLSLALADAADAAKAPRSDADGREAVAATSTAAPSGASVVADLAASVPVTTVMLSFDPDELPVSAFGDLDERHR